MIGAPTHGPLLTFCTVRPLRLESQLWELVPSPPGASASSSVKWDYYHSYVHYGFVCDFDELIRVNHSEQCLVSTQKMSLFLLLL